VEGDALGGFDPYSSSKGCAEIVTAAYRRSFFSGGEVGIASARAGNVIGGGDWSEDRLVPDILRGVVSGRPVPIRNPKAIRPWQHVLEPLAGYLTLAEHAWREPALHGRAYNFGPSQLETLSVGELARRLVEVLGRGELKEERTAEDAAMHEANVLTLDSTLARDKLGWKPVLSLPEAVELTARWYRAYLDDKSHARATLDAQIAEYMGKLG
jgi:CDP-glucose 4,6-dehydratase